MKGFFVTGTDTGVGKTCVSAGLLTLLARQGLRTAGVKPVAAGMELQHGQPVWEDVQALQQASSVALTAQQVCALALRTPCAPHIAAALEGVQIARGPLLAHIRSTAALADVVVVEGAGGFCVPLSPVHEQPAWGLDDVAVDVGLPVVLVVALRLGCINHAQLTAQAIQARGLRLAGWVANQVTGPMAHEEANMTWLRAHLPAPCWGLVPHGAGPHAQQVADHLDENQVKQAWALQV
jgi:dethiobiotin synthetase